MCVCVSFDKEYCLKYLLCYIYIMDCNIRFFSEIVKVVRVSK